MRDLNFNNIKIQPLVNELINAKNISASVLRLDSLHPVISGNKWFKLRYYIEEAKKQNKKTIVTYGGAWSNHILATACACSLNNLKSVGIIRGEEPAVYSETLKAAKEYGMQFYFISRNDYRTKELPTGINAEDVYIIPEGGYGEKGAAGFATALEYCDKNNFTHFICAVGTGTMMAGIIKAVSDKQEVIGIPVLKNNPELLPAITHLLTREEKHKKFKLIEGYHFGGYAKQTPELIEFMNSVYTEFGIPVDLVYTGKLFYAVNRLIQENYFGPGSKILIIHSGGLQGNASLPNGTLIF
jgi:1-aminocyclopropane-1-carboxylate deaminase